MTDHTHEQRMESREELKTRELAKAIAKDFKSCASDRISYNLSNVRIMSRSFADEFHKQKIALEADGIEVEVTEASDSVFRMLQYVAATQDRPIRPSTKLEPIHILSVEQARLVLGV